MADDLPRLTVRPEHFVAGGEVLARHDGQVVFVRGALPGETVEIELDEVKRDWARGHTTVVVSPSPSRVEPPCANRVAGCGGCDWQHLDGAQQLAAKRDVVVEALRRTGRLRDPDVALGASVPAGGYRTTIRVVGTPDRRAGFRMERAHDTVAAAGCLVAHPRLDDLLGRLDIDPGLEVTLRTSVATGQTTAGWDRRAGRVRGLPADVETGRGAAVLEDVAGHRLRVSVGSFFQSGPAAAELLVDAVGRAAPELARASRVVDAYAGVGLFAVTATAPTSRVTLIESSRSAAADAEHNLGGRDAVVRCRDIGSWRPAEDGDAEVVIADPSRTGLGRPGVAALAAAGAPVLALVSCDPVALARDVTLLAAHGYRHERSEVLDLFPMTHHVEVVTRFVGG